MIKSLYKVLWITLYRVLIDWSLDTFFSFLSKTCLFLYVLSWHNKCYTFQSNHFVTVYYMISQKNFDLKVAEYCLIILAYFNRALKFPYTLRAS